MGTSLPTKNGSVYVEYPFKKRETSTKTETPQMTIKTVSNPTGGTTTSTAPVATRNSTSITNMEQPYGVSSAGINADISNSMGYENINGDYNATNALNNLEAKARGFNTGVTPVSDYGTLAGKSITGNVAGNSIPTSVYGTRYGTTLGSPTGMTGSDFVKSALASSGSKKSGSGSGSSSSSADGVNGAYAAYMQLAAAQMAAQQARADQAAAAQRAAAENAYNRGISALETAYGNKMNMLNNNYNSTLDQLKNALTYSQGNVNSDADASLKQAYINNMMNQKNLNQQLTAQGLSGGASESTLARLLTNYGNSRNNIENTRNSNLEELYNTYNNNLSSANQAYNNALANAEADRMQYLMNLENALANNQIATEQNYQNALTANNDTYLSALANAVDMMNAYNYSPSAATNDVNLATVLQNAVNSGVYNRNANTGVVEQAATTELEKANNNAYINALLKSMYGE